ncbi:MAG TPA: hypothetical protein ENI23_16975 [bacterium]|nr:hypothetical protein [bacterium]
MPKFSIPDLKKNQWRGIFKGEFGGNIWMGKNIDLEKSQSKVQLADSFSDLKNNTDTGFTNLETSVAFVRTSADGTDRFWANAGRLFKTTSDDPESWDKEDDTANAPTAPLYDMIDFLGALIVPTATDLARLSTTWDPDWWSTLTGASALTSAPHRFSIFAGALTVTDGRFINDWDGTIARDPALTLPVNFEARWSMVWRDLEFFGGVDTSGREANIYTWRRSLSTYESAYPIGDVEALCGFVLDVPYIITKKGAIKRFNGVGFELVQQFPTVELDLNITSIHPNGVVTQENIARILVNFGTSANTRVISGFWTYDSLNNNLYHSGSVKNTVGNDYAQHELSDVGAFVLTSPTQGLYLAGAKPFIDYNASTTRFGIFSSDEGSSASRGYIITPKIPSTDARNYWRYITAKISRMTNAGDVVRAYYRSQDSNDLPTINPDYETITWTAANQFTASNSDIAVGDLVEVIAGDNAGALERITVISGSTVTIATSLFASTATARVRYLRFNEIGSITSQAVQETRFGVATRSNWVQFIIAFIGSGTSPALERLLIEFTPKKV